MYHARHANPKFGPVKVNKQDISDGFYQLFLQARACLHLALILPCYEDEPQLIAVPMSCTMGWVQSPPTFCTVSETLIFVAWQYQSEAQTGTCHARRVSRIRRICLAFCLLGCRVWG